MPQVPQGVKISAYIFYAFAALGVLGLCVNVGLNGMNLANTGFDSDAATGLMIGIGVGLCIGLIFIGLYGFVGYSLMKMQKWARIAAIVLAVILLCGFPIGTAAGGYILYSMFQPDVKQAFA